MSKELFIQGNESFAIGAIKAGCRFFAGYPITPSTEIAEKWQNYCQNMVGYLYRWKMK